MKFAYIKQGKLYYSDGQQAAMQIESQYAQDVVNNALARQQKNSWKTGGDSAAAMMARQSMGMQGGQAVKVDVSAITSGSNADELLYVVATDAVGGLFSYSLSKQKETRIFHKEQLHLSDFRRNPSKDVIACSQRAANGTATISVVQGNDISQVTEGDSSDEAPSWVQNNDKQLVYQSAGIARNQQGFMMGLGPSAIMKLDLQNGTVSALLENEGYDYLSPHMTAKGELFYIKRPYEAIFKRNYPLHKMALDALLFPFRLIRAFFDFLNFFSMAFSKKPLTTAGGPKLEGPDEKTLLLKGKLIDAEAALKENNGSEDALRLVPSSWQLSSRDSLGKEQTLAEGVLAYDLSKDGKIVYSTGAALYECNSDGSQKKLLSLEKFVDTILILD
ncbi:MAG: hypothetical protein K2X27_03560 [Candidatus Obscuribacterales bacterium]|nr:hypothetical protein [Candidatus Obscuribacterales bacterium]